MAARDVVVCELLCFLRKNFDKLTVSQIKPVVVTFYQDDELVKAKDILLKATARVAKDAGIEEVDIPRMPKRQGDNKCKQTTDDILKLFTFADERNLVNALPRFVAEDLSRIPFINADSMSLINMARKMETLEQRMLNMEQLMSRSSLKEPVKPPSVETATDIESETFIDNNEQVVESATCGVSTNMLNDWKMVTYKKDSKKEVGEPNNIGSLTHSSNQRSVKEQKVQPKGKQKVMGARVDGDTIDSIGAALKPGVHIIKKAVVHIDNLGPDCTEALLQDYLLAADINVLSCYVAKSWLREQERAKVTAFRVCVPLEQRQLILDPQLWSQGVIIRDWLFKKSSNGGHA
jgi:hypothetical protein